MAGGPVSAELDSVALRGRLEADRAATAEQIESLRADWSKIVEASALVATDDEHDPEGSTIAFERSQVAALIVQARARLDDLDRAVDQLSRGSYGRCAGCGLPIGEERLAARPAARTCISCAKAAR